MVIKIVLILISYFYAAIPFSYVLPKFLAGVDVRKVGSGNIGSTNVMRAAGKKIGFICVLADSSKGIVTTLIYMLMYGRDYPTLFFIIIATFLGHSYSIFLKFKGGKGVATSSGATWVLSPMLGFLTTLVWIFTNALTGYVSVASMAGGIFASVIAYFHFFGLTQWDFYSIITMTGFIILKHKSNIKRLFSGKEPKTYWVKFKKS
jgi:glycerol-3-phosphate acyltransferase PlsY